MRFEFSTSNRILFGPGVVSEVPDLSKVLGRKAILFLESADRSKAILNQLVEARVEFVVFEVRGEPKINDVLLAMRIIKESNINFGIGIGGGSVIDTGKAALVLAANPGNPLDYLEVVGNGRLLEQAPIPYMAIPTTAGTGAEVTRNAVIALPEFQTKVSLRSPYLLPRIAVIDPELTYTLPPAITASTGLDALTQLLEPFICNSPTPLTDVICREGIRRVGKALLSAFTNGKDEEARESMSLASLFGGLALANARLGAVHGLAGPIGGKYSAPHGVICANLLAKIMRANYREIIAKQPDAPILSRFVEIAQLLTGNPRSAPEDGLNYLDELVKILEIPSLGKFGLREDDFPGIIEKAQKSSSMKGNPIRLPDPLLAEILSSCI